MDGNGRLDRYAELAIRSWVNLAPGQELGIGALPEHAPLVRALARAAYRAAVYPAGPDPIITTSYALSAIKTPS